jgi:hypothetical protein
MGPKALTFIHSVARKSLTKGQGSGITKIPSAMQAEAKASEIFTNLVEAGLKPEMMDDFIRSEADVAKYLNILDAYKRERMKPIPADSPRGREITEALFGKRGEVVDMKGNVIPEGSGIMGGESIESLMKSGDVTKGTVTKKSKKVTDRDMFKAANENYITDTISKIKSMDPIEAMKEANKVIKREGPYKNLNQQQAKKILEDTEDHIFERDVTPMDEDFAAGGRVGLKGGGMDMGAGSSKSSKTPGPDRSKVSAQQELNHQAAVREAQAFNQKKEETINRIKKAQPKQSPIKTFFNPRLQKHFDQNQMLKDAVARGEITPEQYNQLGGYDVQQTLSPGNPVLGGIGNLIGSTGYNVVQSLKGEQPFSDIPGDVMRNVQGGFGLISPELKQTYKNILAQGAGQYQTGGRAGFKGGGMDMGGNNFKSDPDDNREQYGAQGQYSRPPSTPSDGGDNREQYGAQGQYQRPPSTPSDGGGDNKINLINTLNKFRPDTFVNPYNFSVDLNKNIGPFGLNSFINTLGILGIDDPRTPEDESEQDDYGISASYIRDLLGGDLVLGAGYSPTTGTNLGLSFSKQFNQGGRVNYNEGSLDPDTGSTGNAMLDFINRGGLKNAITQQYQTGGVAGLLGERTGYAQGTDVFRRQKKEIPEEIKKKIFEMIMGTRNLGKVIENSERTKSRIGSEGVKAYGLAEGGRTGYKEGFTAKQFKRQETENLAAKINEYFDIKGSGSISGKNQIMGAPDGITANTETFNAIINMDIPIIEKINLLGSLGYGKDRFKVEKGDEELFLGEGGYKDRNIGLGFNQGGEGLSGSVIRNLETGDNEYQVKFLKNFASGGRVGLAGGMTRRAFLKLMGGVAAGIGAIKSGIIGAGKKGVAKKVVKEVIKTPPVAGKPEWFDALINKVILEGDDVTKKLATKDREIVHTKKLNDQESVTVTQDLDDGAIRVEYDSPDNLGQEPVMMQFKPGMADETTGGKKPADRFDVVETEPRYVGPDNTDIEFIGESGGPNISFIESDVTNLKTFATGKGPTMKEIVKSKKRKDLTRAVNENDYEAAEYLGGKYGDAPEPDFPDDYSGYASGGLAYMLGE